MHKRTSSGNYSGSQVYQAILVMDSRNVRTAVRNQAQPSRGWSQLYQAGPYHLDLSLKPDEQGARLIGQLISGERISFEGASIRLSQAGARAEGALDLAGRFSLNLGAAGECDLELQVEGSTIRLDGLKLS